MISIGIILFIRNYFKKKFKINFKIFFLILFLFCFFTHNNYLNFDSPFYHLQIIKWSYEYKISLGLVNLEPRYAMSSIWHLFLSFLNYEIFKFNPIYLISLIVFSFFYNQLIQEKNFKSLSSFYIYFVNSFLFFFAFIHPSGDGIIFNNLGSPETDIIGIVFFSYSFYFFLKILEKKDITDFHYLIIFCFYSFFTKISYISLIFLIFISIIIFKKKVLDNKRILVFLFCITLLWFIRNLFISGCLIFPIPLTCYDFFWSGDINNIEQFYNEIKSFSRDTRLRQNYTNFDYTLNSFEWFIPWFMDYFINTSVLKILSLSFVTSFIILIIGFVLKKIDHKNLINYKNFIIFAFVILSISVWLQAPEVRYAHGLIILLIFLNFIIVLKIIDLKFNYHEKILKFFSFSLLILLSFKNIGVVKSFNKTFSQNFDYSNILEIKNIDNYQIFSAYNDDPNIPLFQTFCLDFKKICVYDSPSLNNLKISKNYGYFIFEH